MVAAGLAGAVVVMLAAELRLAGIWPRLDDPDFDLDGPLGSPATGAPLRIVWLGDSTARGEGVSHADDTLPRLVASGLDVPVELTVLAVSGARVADVLDAQAPRIRGLRPDVVFVSVGANDSSHLRTRGRFRRSYEELVRSLPEGALVMLLGVPDMGAAIPPRIQPLRAFSEWRGRLLDAEVRRVARSAGAVYVDIAGSTGRVFRRHRDRLYADDRYHPDEAGYRLWARAVLDAPALTGLAKGFAAGGGGYPRSR